MEKINVDITKPRHGHVIPQKTKNTNKLFYHENNIFHKELACNEKAIEINKPDLISLDYFIDMINSLKLEEVEGACGPIAKLYYNDIFIGYATRYLDGFTNIVSASLSLSIDEKIDLLIKLSKIVKKLHERGLIHYDLDSCNILSNKEEVEIIDFDEGYVFFKGQKTDYDLSPYVDINKLNEIILLVLTGIEETGKIEYIKEHMQLPLEIAKYFKHFDIWSSGKFLKRTTASIPSEYPHDWLDSLRGYVKKNGILHKK